MIVRHPLHCGRHCWASYISYDPAGDVACQEGHNLQVCSLDTPTNNRHVARDYVGHNTQGNLQALPLNSQFAMPEVAICTEKVIIPALGAGISFKGERLKHPPEHRVQHLSVCMVLLIQPLLINMAVLDRNRQGEGPIQPCALRASGRASKIDCQLAFI